jgi:hypothetical protein
LFGRINAERFLATGKRSVFDKAASDQYAELELAGRGV